MIRQPIRTAEGSAPTAKSVDALVVFGFAEYNYLTLVLTLPGRIASQSN
ncbi:MAG: hypothetical protein HYT16_00495 [DPANN group archaeon]|nr:hypothetical protein [DPANN group archaeon]